MLRLDMQCRQSLGLDMEMDISGGITQSVFPLTEAKLNKTDYQKALQYVAKRKLAERYVSMVDFLFCETFTQFRFHCFKFYNDEGLPLRDMPESTSDALNAYDMVMCDITLELALQAQQEALRASWQDIHDATHNYIRRAA